MTGDAGLPGPSLTTQEMDARETTLIEGEQRVIAITLRPIPRRSASGQISSTGP